MEKNLLTSKGITVIEYTTGYSKAVEKRIQANNVFLSFKGREMNMKPVLKYIIISLVFQ